MPSVVANKTPAKDTKKDKRKKEIPKEFIKKIKKLGMKEENAQILYETKIDWTAVYSENKIFCTETRCDFHTKIDSGEMTQHVITNHKYGEYPCSHDHCNFVGFSQVIIATFYLSDHKCFANMLFRVH